MTTRHRAICITRWTLDDDGITRLSLAAKEAPNGVSVTDVTAQPADPITGEARTSPDVLIVAVSNLRDAHLAAMQADNRFYILARQTWDDADEDAGFSVNNFDNPVTAGQVSTFISDIQTRYPDVDTEHLEDAGQAAIEAGLTRQQVIKRLVRRWAPFVKVLA